MRSRNAGRVLGFHCAIGLLVAVTLTSHAHAMSGQADIIIVEETPQQLTVKFIDDAGQPLTVMFTQVTEEGHTFWKPISQIHPTTGVSFGNTSPTLPNTVRLRDRDIDPGDVVEEFKPSIAAAEFDDISIYQSYHGEIAVALHEDDLVTSIHYAGLFVPYTIQPLPPVPHCQVFESACCRTTWVSDDPENPQGPGHEVPDPYLPGCLAGHEHCSAQTQSDICTCLLAACEAGTVWEWDVHVDACIEHINLCIEEEDNDIGKLINVMSELIVLK